MDKDVLAGLIGMSLIFVYNFLLKTDLTLKHIVLILSALLGVSVLLTRSWVHLNFTAFLTIKIIILAALIIVAGFVFYKSPHSEK